ncbi:MAG: branched-chain amino acid ABC transporter permease [Desulfovibrio sp.]|jgi:branched-chain amino acid transport system permease protein|nr:branched-chain amino acid ABC transporter permease [Desulfovibrio sp.]
MNDLLAAYGNLIDMIFLNSIIAYSVWLTLSANMFSMATGGFLSLGAYTCVYLTMQHGLPFFAGAAAAALAATAVALILGLPLLRLRGDYFALATLAFTEVVRVVALNWESVTGGALGIFNIPKYTDTAVLLIVFVLAVYFCWALEHSPEGRARRSMRRDETPAAAMGVNIFTHKLALFAASGFLAGLAGALAGHLNYFIGPNDFGLMRTIDALAYPILGGVNSLAGPALGAAVFTIFPEFLRFSNQMREIILGAVFVLAVLLLPNGLTSFRGFRGSRRRERRMGVREKGGG